MAATFQSLAKAGLPAPRIFLLPWVAGSCPTCCRCPLGAKRYLLTDNVLKLKEFQHKKVAVACNLPGTKETYFRNLEEKLTQKKLILKDELTTLLHLCQSQEDVELAKSVIHRYHAENRNMTLGEYKFGPVFMRLCYEMDLEESAVELIKDQHLRGFFSDSTSFSILMDMLFIKGNYEGALEVLIEMKNQDVKFTQDTYVLAFAICYKLNSPESFKICTTLREDALVKGDIISKRASCFAVALALNQNEVAKAVSIFSQIMNPVSIACTNLNLAKVKEKVKDVPALVARYEEIYGKLHIHGQVTSYTLDALLCYTPRNKNSHTSLLNRRKFSQRTFQPLNKSLLVE
ncbi:pentatricopeptide repeat-containing protein 2, mitochondrial isoform X3 [Fukomys damarensis]|uniref:pentatricopeptide repeat-containing protein 2, mitochondrial isoform X3 n=1 Tax=Fukomys damarensis TaxID=885580 RepID=UPI0008FF752A|nr:pentatricopeptide repeat-containing protein 2, mitochondrial isoform X3 [Fukomys damarensis]